MTTWSSTTRSTTWRSSRSALLGKEPYMGEWDSEEDFAEHIIDECYDLDRIMGNLSGYFDYKRFADDLFMSDYTMGEHGYVFRNI